MLNRTEFEDMLISPNFFELWSGKTKSEVEELIGKDVAQAVDFDQKNPHHCHSLYMHSLHTVCNVKKRIDVQSQQGIFLVVAAFFHDIGKVQAAKPKDGRLTFQGHAAISQKLARPILRQLGYSEQETENICFYIRHHDDFMLYVLPSEKAKRRNAKFPVIDAASIKAHIDAVNADYAQYSDFDMAGMWKMLTNIFYADAKAQSQRVIRDGRVIDSMAHKLKKTAAVDKVIQEIYP